MRVMSAMEESCMYCSAVCVKNELCVCRVIGGRLGKRGSSMYVFGIVCRSVVFPYSLDG